jgi:hypothetical protein
VLLGVIGHDPWKTQDALSFGVALDMIERGNALAPRLAGEPYLDNPPLAYWLAAGTALALSPPLSLHDAARVASALVLGLTLFLLATTAKELEGSKARWTTVLLFVGSVGLWERAHQLSAELVLMLAIAVAQYGLAISLRRPLGGGAWLGIGAAIAFLSTGLNGPVWIALAVVVPADRLCALAYPPLRDVGRSRARRRDGAERRVAARALLSRARCTSRRGGRRRHRAISSGRSTRRPPAIPPFLLKNLPWFAWPAVPLVVWTLVTRVAASTAGSARRASSFRAC